MNSIFKQLLASKRARQTTITSRSPIDVQAVIERSLRDAGLLPAAPVDPDVRHDDTIIEGQFQNVDEARNPGSDEKAGEQTGGPDRGCISAGRFALGSASRTYKLFVPAGFVGQQLPLIVMLHGCTQDPDDFARGTRMNSLAQETGALVLYPAQSPRSNSSRCWNWFQTADQHRDAGEPALLAAMTRHIIATHPVDPRRVHVAGLSAGGAMAAILGREYPDLYASIGVHSGLAPGAAHDMASAFAAMTNAPKQGEQKSKAPVIVFHGDRDQTVDPQNGENVVGTAGARTTSTAESGHRYTRTLIKGSDDRIRAEHWLIHGAGHAWSGGSSKGSYTDTLGPDASREMLRFFREHPLDNFGA